MTLFMQVVTRHYNMASKKDVQLYCAWFCPFAQRAWVALLEKNVDFEYIETDPYNKTPEFLAVNPRGLVPAVIHKGRAIYESSICVEYIDEVWQNEPHLLPTEPYERAVARIWVDFIGKKIIPVYYRIVQKQDKEEQDQAKEEFLKNLETLTEAISETGPYFFGENFTIVDIILASYTLRLNVLEFYRNFEIPNDSRFARFFKWREAAEARPSIKATAPDSEKILARYIHYAQNTAQSEVADAIRKGTAFP
uniref:glutathione transferase n=4 Tax=Arion vulgaris TaxID=1028688 RepID=A0A0B7BC75_9EUPU